MLTVIVNIYINLGCQNLYFLGIKLKKNYVRCNRASQLTDKLFTVYAVSHSVRSFYQ